MSPEALRAAHTGPRLPQRTGHSFHLRLVSADPVKVQVSDGEGRGDVATWSESIGGYMNWLGSAGRSRGTLRVHRHYVSNMVPLAPRPALVTEGTLTRFLATPRWAPETRKSARSVAVGFFSWAHRKGIVPTNPAGDLPPVTVPPALAKPAPEHVLAEALEDAEPRVRLMLLLAAYAGLRCAEISRVHRDDFTEGFLFVVGKGGRQRIVPITHPEIEWGLRRAEGWAFPNGLGSHLSPGHVTKLLSQALPGDWTGHKLRHRFATRSYAANPDLLALGQVLGHSRPETTQRYVRVSHDALRAVVNGAR